MTMTAIEDGIAFLKEVLTYGSHTDELNGSESYDVVINIRNGGSVQTGSAHKDLHPDNLEHVEILYTYDNSEGDEWDGTFSKFVIFEAPTLFGIATQVGWYGPTFGGDTKAIEVTAYKDWEMFINFCLTDEIREAALSIIEPAIGLTSGNRELREYISTTLEQRKNGL